MDVLVEKSDAKLREWPPNIVVDVRERISEVIYLINEDLLDIMQPRAVKQEVLDLIDEPVSQ